jgi:transposase InsO family protein
MNGQERRLSNMTDEWAAACAAAHAARSMSRKARSPDNARCEGFFGTLKSDFFHGTGWRGVTFAEFRARLSAYIEWHGAASRRGR